jgi:peptide/nickel transport system permease protein
MGRYIARRLIQSFFVVLAVIILVFVLARLTGDPADLYLPLHAPEEMRQAFREANGLNRPIIVQLGYFLVDVARLDFGRSMWQKVPALPLVLQRLPLTLELAAVTIVGALALAFVLGSISALYPLSLIDRVTTFVCLIGVTVADFWLALVLILIFAVHLGWLPTSGTGGWKYLVLPGITLAWRPLGRMAQVVRSSVLEQLSAPYITTARAKGLRERVVLWRHVARNGIIPVLTLAGIEFIGLANGAVIVETVFGWPGIGKLTIDALERRDFAVIQAAVFVVAVLVVLVNLFIDFCYAAADPRIRYHN